MTASVSSAAASGEDALRLLLVDDDRLSGFLQMHMAALLGHIAIVETDPRRAIGQALEEPFDLMLLDLGMPDLDGFDALQELRAREAERGRRPLPVIAVTGYAADEDRLRCLTAGFADHLAKPVQVATLKAAIERVVGLAGSAGSDAQTDAARLRETARRLGATRPEEGAFAPTVTESFALHSAQMIDRLAAAADRNDSDEAQRAAAALRSGADFLGATRLAQMAQGASDAAAAGDWAAVRSQLGAIEHEHQVVLTLLFEAAR